MEFNGKVKGKAYSRGGMLRGTAFLGTTEGSKGLCEYGCSGMV